MQMRHFDIWSKYNCVYRWIIIALVVNTSSLMKREQDWETCSRALK